jgi:hypothetical protein
MYYRYRAALSSARYHVYGSGIKIMIIKTYFIRCLRQSSPLNPLDARLQLVHSGKGQLLIPIIRILSKELPKKNHLNLLMPANLYKLS